jgi:LEA14-like dessication related protein
MPTSLFKTRRQLSLAAGLTLSGLIAGGLAACNAVPPLNLKAPEVGFSDLSVSDVGFSNIKFVVTVNADNSNDVDIPLSDAKFELSLMGNSFANGVAKETSIVIPKKGKRAIPIEFTVPTSQLIDTVKKLNLKDLSTFTYALKGSARWGSGPFSIPFERKGDLAALKSVADLLRVFTK